MTNKNVKDPCLKHSECSDGNCKNGKCAWPRYIGDHCIPEKGWQGSILARCDKTSHQVVNINHEAKWPCKLSADCLYTQYCKLGANGNGCVDAMREGAVCATKNSPPLDNICQEGLKCIEREDVFTCRQKCFLDQNGCPQGQICAQLFDSHTIGICIPNTDSPQGGTDQGQQSGGNQGQQHSEQEPQSSVEHQEKPLQDDKPPQNDKPIEPPKDNPEAGKKPKEVEVEEEVEEVEPATGKKTKKLVKKKKPAATSSTVPTSVSTPQNLWTKRFGLPNMTNRELAIYGSVAGAVLLIIVFIIVMVVLSCKRRRQRSKSLNAADGLNQQPLSATDLPTYEQSLDSTRAATPGEESVIVGKGDLKEKKF